MNINSMPHSTTQSGLVDSYGRTISYLRVSVTDRCDFRCQYCMSESMNFLPRNELLTIEELGEICSAFIKNGIKKIRLSGGEPLVRRGLMDLITHLSSYLQSKTLDELTLTTNASQLGKFADPLASAGVKRVNVSLDTLDPEKFKRITRRGDLAKVLGGIQAAQDVGLKIKINTVVVKGINDQEIDTLLNWAGARDIDLTLIETMPLGEISGNRQDQYVSLTKLMTTLGSRWKLTPSDHKTGGPAQYYDIGETGTRLGLITPLSHNFCNSCNRIRLTCTGQLYMCLGQNENADFRKILREGGDLDAAIANAIFRKPKQHDFVAALENNAVALTRHMSVTGG